MFKSEGTRLLDLLGLLAPRPDLGLRSRSREWRELLARDELGRDLGQGLALAATMLPLSVLLASLAGAPASSGLLSAVIGSVACVLMGGTRIALSGPGLTSALVSSTVIARHGLSGLGVVLGLVGLLHLATGALGIGRFARLAPLSIVRACVFAVGLVVLLRALPYALGGTLGPGQHEGVSIDGLSTALARFDPVVLGIAVGSGLLGAIGLWQPKVPGALVAFVAAAAAARFWSWDVPTVYESSSLPTPRVPLAQASDLPALVASAFELWGAMTLATLLNTVALERLKSDAGITERTDPDQELIGNGLATILLSFIHGLPATQLVARSAIGIRLGVASRRPALVQALVLLGVGIATFPLLSYVPLAALVGVAVVVAVPLLDVRPHRVLAHVSPIEFAISVAVVVVMVLLGIISGLLVGLAAAFALVALRLTRTRSLVQPSATPDGPHQVTISGPLTFLAGLEKERLRQKLAQLDPSHGLVVDMRSVVTVDAGGALALLTALDEWRARSGRVALLGPSAAVKDMLLRADETERPLAPGVERGQLAYAMAPNDRALDVILDRPGLKLARSRLLAGLTRFREEMRDHYDSLFAQLADGQHPHTLFITCADSRINPALLMGSHPGDLFIVRAIGALVPPAEMDAMPQEGAGIEYAVGVLGVKTIVVCGHSKCGAISALKGGHLPAELRTLQAWSRHASRIAGDVAHFSTVDEATRAVVRRQIDNLLSYPLVHDKVQKGELHLHAWFYDLGEVELFEWDPARQEFGILGGEGGPPSHQHSAAGVT